MNGNAPHAVLTRVPGWETEDEQNHLVQLARNVKPGGHIVEIGAEYGMSASLFCAGADPSVTITSVDLFPGDMLSIHRANLAEAGFKDRSRQIQGDSALVGKQWTDGPIHLLFVDGDHHYEGCKADIDAWIPHITKGGIVAFHDCANVANRMPHYLHFSVTRAVSEWFWDTAGKWRALTSVNTILSFERLK